MRPCQQCNGPLGNNEKVCPTCGAAQQATIGFQKAAPAAASPLDDELPSGWSDVLRRLESLDVFDPRAAAGLCVLGVAALLGILYLMNPVGALVVFGACSVLSAVIVTVINGG
ncbi:MAG: hypothetical protein AB7I48_08280 [Planctomycetaceae bacterium]